MSSISFAHRASKAVGQQWGREDWSSMPALSSSL